MTTTKWTRNAWILWIASSSLLLLLLLLSVCLCVCVVRFVSKQIIRFVFEVCVRNEKPRFLLSNKKTLQNCRQTKNAHKKKSLTALHIF
jgi:hypothetical protein